MERMLSIGEIFDLIENESNRKKKKEILLKNDHPTLREILKHNFDPTIEFENFKIPEYIPDDLPPGYNYSNIYQESKKFYLFVKNSDVPIGLTNERRTEILWPILESLDKKEAEIFEAVLQKKLKVGGLTKKLIEEVFPDLLTKISGSKNGS